MKVILLQDVKGVGKKYEVRTAADGYGRNFLIARKLAELATPEAIKRAEHRAKNTERNKEEASKNIEKMLNELNGKEFEIMRRVNEQGTLFDSLSRDEIASMIGIDADLIDLAHPIKHSGKHTIELKNSSRTATITIDIKSES